jgi:two-component system, chemotaxis family, sensor kinase CheA
VAVLDQLMNLAGELVLGRNQLLQTIASNDSRMLELVGTRLNQVTSELQETIMRTRMQPVGNVFNKFTRIVRDLSNMLNKQCNLVIEGQEVELDKTIIEAIGDPLTHLIRNSVDHGVELPEARKQKGKPETGTVYLRAYHQDGKVNIAIKDDGAGIDADKLKVKAIEKGILTEDKAASMSDAEALRLIFAPGFSTAEQISAVSGRGVGMDVVKTNFERLGGSVDIDTVLGKGTTITVRLPLTLAIVPSLIVRAGNQRLAVPQTNICELVRIRQGDETRHIERLRNSEVLRLRGRLLPLVRLTRVLDNPDVETTVDTAEPASASAAAINIIVVEAGNLRYGLVVDGLHDSEEIVVKPLGRHMSDVHILAGATVLGDGQVALILDISGVAAKVGLTTTDEAEDASANADSSDNQETITTLLFTNHPSEQFAIPMNSVSRIERILIEQLDSIGGQEVLQYRDRTLPLISVEKTITAKSREEQTRLYVVVFQAGSREVGLIAPCILDICNIPSELDTHTFQETGVLGSLVLNGNATRVIDAYDLAADQHPEWFAATTKSAVPHATKSNAPEHGATPRILLAEDSSFFRAKVKSFLEQLGTEVIGCEDGSLAWEELQTSTEPFAIVVTDIEMPNMNGFELCERIKSDDRFKHLPVIALTSLASDENVQRGRIVGVDEYLIKLDRDKLVMTVTSMLAERVTPERKRQVAVATH